MKKRAHRRLQESLLLYLDGELSREAGEKIEGHLSGCPECRRLSEALADLWKPAGPEKRLSPPPSLWPGLLRRIESFEPGSFLLSGLRLRLQRITLLVAVVFCVSLAVGAGVYLGQPGQAPTDFAVQAESVASAAGRELGLDQFKALLPGSLSDIFLSPAE